jgi:hypothetical protein
MDLEPRLYCRHNVMPAVKESVLADTTVVYGVQYFITTGTTVVEV